MLGLHLYVDCEKSHSDAEIWKLNLVDRTYALPRRSLRGSCYYMKLKERIYQTTLVVKFLRRMRKRATLL